MQYLSIDIETTGLSKENHQILSIAAILEDTTKKLSFDEIPKFHAAIVENEIRGSHYAINLNRDLIGFITEYLSARNEEEKREIESRSGMKFYHVDQVVEAFFHFLIDNGLYEFSILNADGLNKVVNGKPYPVLSSKLKPVTINVAGKNFATFDKQFLEKLPHWQQVIRIRQRIIDPGILYTNWNEDESIPNLSQCKSRAGLSSVVTHNALEDAWDVIELLRKTY
jgi:hypothetical protein